VNLIKVKELLVGRVLYLGNNDNNGLNGNNNLDNNGRVFGIEQVFKAGYLYYYGN